MTISTKTSRSALAFAATGAVAMLLATMPAQAAPWARSAATTALSAGTLPVEHVSWRGRRNGALIAGAIGLGVLGIAAAAAASQPRHGYAPAYGYGHAPAYGYAPQPSYGHGYGYAPVQTYAPAYVEAPAYGYEPVYAQPSYGYAPVYVAPRHAPVYGDRGYYHGRVRAVRDGFRTQNGDIIPMRGNNGGG
ncbi:MAG: hypothetical protein MUC44_13275 [Beijerinckiaceae bacterium]|jgi:hypothetical protein|nr:hypothetical protein [Beijerinckiaceae bacterium]